VGIIYSNPETPPPNKNITNYRYVIFVLSSFLNKIKSQEQISHLKEKTQLLQAGYIYKIKNNVQ
jgi:hypothetical protein